MSYWISFLMEWLFFVWFCCLKAKQDRNSSPLSNTWELKVFVFKLQGSLTCTFFLVCYTQLIHSGVSITKIFDKLRKKMCYLIDDNAFFCRQLCFLSEYSEDFLNLIPQNFGSECLIQLRTTFHLKRVII